MYCWGSIHSSTQSVMLHGHPRRLDKRRFFLSQKADDGNRSQPILSFSHENSDDQYLDIAVQPDLGLIAASQDANSSTAIRIYNMWTGKLLREVPQPRFTKVSIRCLRFMEDRDGDPELWSSWGGSIVKMSLA